MKENSKFQNLYSETDVVCARCVKDIFNTFICDAHLTVQHESYHWYQIEVTLIRRNMIMKKKRVIGMNSKLV